MPSPVSRAARAARLTLVSLAVFALLALAGDASTAPGAARASSPPVRFELYAMSQCPYCAKVLEALEPVATDLGPALALSIDYVGTQSEQGELSSMHGRAELVGDLAQICAERLARGVHLRMAACQSRDLRNVDKNWESCARTVGVPVEPLRRCIEGAEGKRLLAASFARAKSRGVAGAPTMFIDGNRYEGQRGSMALTRAICAAARDPKPGACLRLPPLPTVHVTILTDKRCPDCNEARIESRIQNAIANPVVTKLDYADPVGRRLFATIKPVELPAAVFDASLDADPDAAAHFASTIRQVGARKVLGVGGSWNPECADPGGCGRAACRNKFSCRPETPGTLELFMMSQCPFAARALQALPDALEQLGPGVRLSVHYIGSGDRASGLKSMHGEAEVREDMRQLCAIKTYPKSFLKYLTCRAGDYRGEDWKACTGAATGIEAAPIERCVGSGEGARLLEQSFRLSEALGVGASPTWVAAGKRKFSGVDADAIRNGFCQGNAKLKACAGVGP